MSDDSEISGEVDSGPGTAFYLLVGLVAILTFAGAVFVLGNIAGDPASGTAAPTSSSGPLDPAVPATSGARPTATTAPSTVSSRAAAAVAKKYLRLGLAGRFDEACALQSPAYLQYDAATYAQGSCEAVSQAVADDLASRGLSLRVTDLKVQSHDAESATILVKVALGDRSETQHMYMQLHNGTWWITGSDDTGGDLGY